MEKESVKWVAQKFGIPEEDVVWYNSGICYSRAVVRTRSSAEKISKAVQGNTVNGGMLDGMPLGGISSFKTDKGEIQYDVTC